MIDIIFSFGNEFVFVRVDGVNVLFADASGKYAPVSGLRLSRDGVIKEFPDLANTSEWRRMAIERFKEKIKSYPTEDARVEYIISDLRKFGYVPYKMQKVGHRPVKIKGGENG